MPGSYSRNKGRRLEQEVVNLLKSKKLKAHRMSMIETGRIVKGDILVHNKWKAEVKGGSQVPKFVYNACKDGEDMLLMRRDRHEWKICMDLEWFLDNFLNGRNPLEIKEEIEEKLEE